MKNNMLRSKNYVIKVIAMFCAVIFAFSSFGTSNAFAAEASNNSAVYVENEENGDMSARTALILDKWGTLSPNQQITGTFTFTKWTGTDFWAQVCAGSGNGYVKFSIEAESANIPCGTVKRLLLEQVGLEEHIGTQLRIIAVRVVTTVLQLCKLTNI